MGCILDKKLLFFVFILCIFLIDNVNAEMLVSDEGVEYDSELIDQFLLNDWVPVMVKIKDTTNITIPKKDSSDFESKINERTVMLRRKFIYFQ